LFFESCVTNTWDKPQGHAPNALSKKGNEMTILDAKVPNTPERSATLTEQVVDAILRGAIERRIPFGARLVEAEIAKELNVSRVPVREALRLLCSQGLVENKP
jgi:DNA-binding GntR family transcriptional regulator